MVANRFSLGDEHGILVLPETDCCSHVPAEGAALIRIACSRESFLDNPNESLYVESLRLQFDDIGGPSNPEWVHFTSEHAKTIVDFFERNKERRLVVHCGAGLSRSAGVGISFAYFKRDVEACRALSIYFATANALVTGELRREIERRWEIEEG